MILAWIAAIFGALLAAAWLSCVLALMVVPWVILITHLRDTFS